MRMAPVSVQNGDRPLNGAQQNYEVEQILLGDPSESNFLNIAYVID